MFNHLNFPQTFSKVFVLTSSPVLYIDVDLLELYRTPSDG